MTDAQTFTVSFVGADRAPIGEPVEISAFDYWEACGLAWDIIPAGAHDFMVEEVKG